MSYSFLWGFIICFEYMCLCSTFHLVVVGRGVLYKERENSGSQIVGFSLSCLSLPWCEKGSERTVNKFPHFAPLSYVTATQKKNCALSALREDPSAWWLLLSSCNSCLPGCQEPSRWTGALFKSWKFAAWIPVELAAFPFRLSPHFREKVQGWKFDPGGPLFSSWCFVVPRAIGSPSPSCPFAHLFSGGWQS